jgi:protein-S-isoprenylcysteine O-methyltransferase Ste14
MSKTLIMIYALSTYTIALVGQMLFILYIGGWEFLPRHINMPQILSTSEAIMIDVFLVVLFGLQHTVMAREGFKKWLLGWLPQPMERATYVLLSGIALGLVYLFWQPIDGVVWDASGSWIGTIMIGLYIFGWVFSTLATFIINHFELFGLSQAYRHLKSFPQLKDDFQVRWFYTFVRHPIQLGIMIGIWATPLMTYGHLLFALLFTIYIMIGLFYEEKDLLKAFKKEYSLYKKEVGMFIPYISIFPRK